MIKFGTALLASIVLLLAAARAQNPPQSPQELPSAPSTVQPHFPGAPVRTEPPSPAPAPPAPSSPEQKTGEQKTGEAEKAAAPDASAAKDAGGSEAQPATAAPSTPNATQSANPEAETGEFKIGVEVDLVNLIFTAVDKHGHFVKDLKKDDVKLLDEGKPPIAIQAFESETGLPLRVGLLIDASNSIRDRFRFEQDSAVQFLQQVVRANSDKAFVIGFDSVSDMTQDYTDDTDALAHGIRVLRPGGGTALHDAVFTASEKLLKAKVRSSARRAIILLSDGDDNQSRHSREEAIEAALRAEVIIYVIDTDVTESNRKGDKVLLRYAEATGGKVFFPLRLEDVATAFNEIQDELRSQYVLAYKPENFVQNGNYRAISVEVPNRSNVKIRARKGYYAPRSNP